MKLKQIGGTVSLMLAMMVLIGTAKAAPDQDGQFSTSVDNQGTRSMDQLESDALSNAMERSEQSFVQTPSIDSKNTGTIVASSSADDVNQAMDVAKNAQQEAQSAYARAEYSLDVAQVANDRSRSNSYDINTATVDLNEPTTANGHGKNWDDDAMVINARGVDLKVSICGGGVHSGGHRGLSVVIPPGCDYSVWGDRVDWVTRQYFTVN